MAPKIKVVIHKAKEGGYWAEVEGMPGCVTEGDTLNELHGNLQDAMRGWMLAQLPEASVAKPAEIKAYKATPAWRGGIRRELVPAF